MKFLLFLFNLIVLQSRYKNYELDDEEAAGLVIGMLILYFIIFLVFILLYIVPMWKIFIKAGKPGWASIIPIYNSIVLLEIVGRPVWWVILFLIPCVNIVFLFIVSIDLAKSFGKEAGFGIGIALLPYIFYPILGFGNAQYVGPSVAPQTPNAPQPPQQM